MSPNPSSRDSGSSEHHVSATLSERFSAKGLIDMGLSRDDLIAQGYSDQQLTQIGIRDKAPGKQLPKRLAVAVLDVVKHMTYNSAEDFGSQLLKLLADVKTAMLTRIETGQPQPMEGIEVGFAMLFQHSHLQTIPIAIGISLDATKRQAHDLLEGIRDMPLITNIVNKSPQKEAYWQAFKEVLDELKHPAARLLESCHALVEATIHICKPIFPTKLDRRQIIGSNVTPEFKIRAYILLGAIGLVGICFLAVFFIFGRRARRMNDAMIAADQRSIELTDMTARTAADGHGVRRDFERGSSGSSGSSAGQDPPPPYTFRRVPSCENL